MNKASVFKVKFSLIKIVYIALNLNQPICQNKVNNFAMNTIDKYDAHEDMQCQDGLNHKVGGFKQADTNSYKTGNC